MAIRPFLYMNPDEGFSTEQASTDELSLGKISLVGVSGIAVDAGSAAIVHVLDPVGAQDAATKAYVDLLAEPSALSRGVLGLTWKPDTARGLSKDSSGGYIKLETDGGVAFNVSGALKVSSSPQGKVNYVAGEDLVNGDVVYQFSTDTVKKGSCTADATARIVGLVDGTSGTGSDAKVVVYGPMTISGASYTVNTPIYLSATGRPTATMPSGANNRIVLLGWAKAATTLFVSIQDLGKKGA